jgi:hypothetical protein
MRRVIIVALVAVAAAVALVGPSAGAKPKPIKPGQFVTSACPSGETADSGTVTWFDNNGRVISTTQATPSGATLTAGPAPARVKSYEFSNVICIRPDPNRYLTGSGFVTDQGLIFYGDTTIPGVIHCTTGYNVSFAQSTFTHPPNITVIDYTADFDTIMAVADFDTTGTIDYRIACVPVA